MKTVIWVIVGYSGSGKSTLAENIHLKLGIPMVTHGEILNELVHQRGYTSSKEFIRDTANGEFKRLFDAFSIERFESLLETKSTMIIEGLASFNVLVYLKSNLLNCVKTFFIDVPNDERIRRIILRDGFLDDDKERAKAATNIEKVIEMADYVIDGMEPPSLMLEKVIQIMNELEYTEPQ